MASYHRVLRVFDRSVQDKSLECDYDVHPWEILINGERWEGKIRLIGFVDVFFLICYSAEARFEKGIIVYKNDDAIRDTLHRAKVDPNGIGLKVVNENERESDPNVPKRYFNFASDMINYTIESLGHKVGLGSKYPKSSVIRYKITMLKSKNPAMKKRIRRGITQHSLLDLMYDAFRLGVVSHAEMMAQLLGTLYTGNTMDDTMRKYVELLATSSQPGGVALSNEGA
ncbi:hypothetical protein EKO27_g2849 [Xylaria grammica]|uniref:Uncharacterized protein n=1 Tax=Xylaria grammica TaxID=363999 RepID=A0A439DCY5_9PEZI|nr:hypothetical protein EKO27_g2849 [Xylaria grammica]